MDVIPSGKLHKKLQSKLTVPWYTDFQQTYGFFAAERKLLPSVSFVFEIFSDRGASISDENASCVQHKPVNNNEYCVI